MINIRRSVFETNSSSAHSIAILKNKDEHYSSEEVLPLFEDHYLKLTDDDLQFGRAPFRLLIDFKEKMGYVVASLYGGGDGNWKEVHNTLDPICRKYDPNFHSIEFPKVPKYVGFDKDGKMIPHNCYKSWKEDYVYYYDHGEQVKADSYKKLLEEYYGDVDHQSIGVLQDFLKKFNISIEEFLTNSKYIIAIDGDEYWLWGDMISLGLVNKDSTLEYSSLFKESTPQDDRED